MKLIKSYFFVACTNANGAPDMFHCELNVTQEQMNNGSHIELAQNSAIANGNVGPFVVFCDSQIKNVAVHVEKMRCPIPFNLVDTAQDNGGISRNQKGSLYFAPDAVNIQFDGHSDSCSVDDEGIPVVFEYYNGKVDFRFYGDINSDEPTASINLLGARNIARID